MTVQSTATIAVRHIRPPSDSELRDGLQQLRSRELVFAVVGYAGSGTSFVATQLRRMLERELKELGYHVHTLKARELLDEYAGSKASPIRASISKLDTTRHYQSLGDKLRSSTAEHGAVAAYAVRRIQRLRIPGESVHNIFIMDSLKHPAEVDLLRSVYGNAFCLVSVGCRPDVRNGRLMRKYDLDEGSPALARFIERDADDSEHKHGQQVNRTFHLADYFVDNTHESAGGKGYGLPDQIKRLFDILFTTAIRRPNLDERGMYAAHSASLRSACLSRQVGAAILDQSGTLLSVGANEVPRAGGGAYDGTEPKDHRCFAQRGFCSNTQEQDRILRSVYFALSNGDAALLKDNASEADVMRAIRGTRIKALIEFSRSVHAEMDAIISLARSGTRLTSGASLFTTTYPCHSCARHIVSAGVSRVVYLEPYSKSMAIELHSDAIADNLPPEDVGDRVSFVPYQGVSPSLYHRVYLKSLDLKDTNGVMIPAQRAPRGFSQLWKKAYTELEQDVASFVDRFEESRHEHG